MRTIAIKSGIVYDGGKLIPWDIFFDVLNGSADQKTTDKVQKKVNGLIEFTPILINQQTNNKEIAEILGVKVINNDLKLKKALMNKIDKLNQMPLNQIPLNNKLLEEVNESLK